MTRDWTTQEKWDRNLGVIIMKMGYKATGKSTLAKEAGQTEEKAKQGCGTAVLRGEKKEDAWSSRQEEYSRLDLATQRLLWAA